MVASRAVHFTPSAGLGSGLLAHIIPNRARRLSPAPNLLDSEHPARILGGNGADFIGHLDLVFGEAELLSGENVLRE
jgi:hypothetical protein